MLFYSAKMPQFKSFLMQNFYVPVFLYCHYYNNMDEESDAVLTQ